MKRSDYDDRLRRLANRFAYMFPRGQIPGEPAPGWLHIVEETLTAIDAALPSSAKSPGGFEIELITEKYGTCRIYWRGAAAELDSKAVDRLVDGAEAASADCCAWCGRPGRLIDGPWAYTACSSHEKAPPRRLFDDDADAAAPAAR